MSQQLSSSLHHPLLTFSSYEGNSQAPGYNQPPSGGQSGGGYGSSGGQSGGYGGSGSHQQPSQHGGGHYNQPPSYSSPPPQSYSQQSQYSQGGGEERFTLTWSHQDLQGRAREITAQENLCKNRGDVQKVCQPLK